MFLMIVVVAALFSSLLAAYLACFGEPENEAVVTFDGALEIIHAIDILRNFFQEYTDPHEPRKPIRNCTKIMIKYVTGTFLFDIIAQSAWPLHYAVHGVWKDDDANLLYLLRLLRLSKVMILMDLQKFTEVVRRYYRKKLVKRIAKNPTTTQESDNNKIVQQIFLIKFFQVFRLIIIILVLSYLLGTLWFILTLHSTTDEG